MGWKYLIVPLLLICVFEMPGVASLNKTALNCFNRTANRAMSGAVRPIAELWDATAYQCMSYCIHSVGNAGEKCWSVVYHKQYYSCQLYHETGTETDSVPVPAYGHDFYLRISDKGDVGNCSSPTFPTTVAATCEEDEYIGYLVSFSTELGPVSGVEPVTLTGVDEGICAEHCARNTDLDNNEISCASANYFPAEQKCDIYSIKIRPNGVGPIAENDDVIYAEKYCVPSDAPDTCKTNTGVFFLTNRDTSFKSDPYETQEITDLNSCIELCIYDDGCHSSVFDENDLECRLHSTGFRDDPKDIVEFEGRILVENACAKTPGVRCREGMQTGFMVGFGRSVEIDSNQDVVITITEATETQCIKACRTNTYSDEEIECGSINYFPQLRNCEIHSLKAKPLGVGTLVADAESIFVQKFCMPTNAPSECMHEGRASTFHVFHIGKNFEVTDLEVLTAVNFAECFTFCVLASPECETVVYNARIADDNCMLKGTNPQEEDEEALVDAQGFVTVVNGCSVPLEARFSVFETSIEVFQGQNVDLSESNSKSKSFSSLTAKPKVSKFEAPSTTQRPRSRSATVTKPAKKAQVLDATSDPMLKDLEYYYEDYYDATEELQWAEWTPCQFVVKGVTVRVRTKNCNIFDCPEDSLQVQKC